METEGRELNPSAPGYNPTALGQHGLPLGPADTILPHLFLPAAATAPAATPTHADRRAAALATSPDTVMSVKYQVV